MASGAPPPSAAPSTVMRTPFTGATRSGSVQRPRRPASAPIITHGKSRVTVATNWIYGESHPELMKGLRDAAPKDLHIWARRRRQAARQAALAPKMPNRRGRTLQEAAPAGRWAQPQHRAAAALARLHPQTRRIAIEPAPIGPIGAPIQPAPLRATRRRQQLREQQLWQAQQREQQQVAEFVKRRLEANPSASVGAHTSAAASQLRVAPSVVAAAVENAFRAQDTWRPQSDKQSLEMRLAQLREERLRSSSLDLYEMVYAPAPPEVHRPPPAPPSAALPPQVGDEAHSQASGAPVAAGQVSADGDGAPGGHIAPPPPLSEAPPSDTAAATVVVPTPVAPLSAVDTAFVDWGPRVETRYAPRSPAPSTAGADSTVDAIDAVDADGTLTEGPKMTWQAFAISGDEIAPAADVAMPLPLARARPSTAGSMRGGSQRLLQPGLRVRPSSAGLERGRPPSVGGAAASEVAGARPSVVLHVTQLYGPNGPQPQPRSPGAGAGYGAAAWAPAAGACYPGSCAGLDFDEGPSSPPQHSRAPPPPPSSGPERGRLLSPRSQPNAPIAAEVRLVTPPSSPMAAARGGLTEAGFDHSFDDAMRPAAAPSSPLLSASPFSKSRERPAAAPPEQQHSFEQEVEARRAAARAVTVRYQHLQPQ